jgi:ribosomal protein S18 acetylase RimI-like enzyme
VSHPLDRTVWAALTGRQAHLAVRHGAAVRLAPDYGLFAACAPGAESDMAALADADGIATVELEPRPAPPGLRIVKEAECVQMVMAAPPPSRVMADHVLLGYDDAAEMLALATLTEPGPFRPKTHRLGRFIGIRREGRLVAMAGERMQPDGFTEVSGVCTHPDCRGQGLAAGLMSVVAVEVVARGETPFLHAYSANEAAVALYEKLGYRIRARPILTTLMPG